MASLGAQLVKHLPAVQETWFNPWVGKTPWRREWQPTPVFLLEKSHGQRSLVGYSPQEQKASDTTEQLILTCFQVIWHGLFYSLWCFVIVQSLSHVQLFATQWTAALELPSPSPSPRVCSNPCPLSRRHHPTISSSAVPFSFCLQSFPASESFPMSRLFASGGQSIGASASASVPFWWIIRVDFLQDELVCFSLESKGLSRVFTNGTIQKHRLFAAQAALWSNPYICTWLLEVSSRLLLHHISYHISAALIYFLIPETLIRLGFYHYNVSFSQLFSIRKAFVCPELIKSGLCDV